MKQVTIYEKGEHILMELEIWDRELKGNDIKYKLKVPGVEDFLEQQYSFDQLKPIEDSND